MRISYLVAFFLLSLGLFPEARGEELSLVFGGDVMLARGVKRAMEDKVYENPFERIKPVLMDADFSLANLEMALDESCEPIEKEYALFRGSEVKELLRRSGLKALSLANNHSIDCGCKGLKRTAEIVDEAGLFSIGDQGLEIVELKGLRLGIMAFIDTAFQGEQLARACKPKMFFSSGSLAEVKEAKKQVELLIVMVHWGDESRFSPSPQQIKTAYALAEAGADLIIGTGPHRVQLMEEYHQSLIAYSLGNLVFDQEGSKGILLKVGLNEQGILYHQSLPILVKRGQPHLKLKSK